MNRLLRRVADTTQPVNPWCSYRWISGSLTFPRNTPNGESALANSPRTLRQSYRRDLVLRRANGGDGSSPGEDKGERVKVHLPGQSESAGGIGKTTCASSHNRSFIVVEHSWRCRGSQLSDEITGDFVAIGGSPVKETCEASIAEVRDEFRNPGESAQLSRDSRIAHEEVS